MTDLLVANVKLVPKMLDSVAGWLDIEEKDVVVSREGLEMVQNFLVKYPKRVNDVVKSPHLVSNVAKIISTFCGPGRKEGGFEAVAHGASKKHRIEFSVFEKALEVMDDLLIGCKNPIDVVKAMSMGEFQTFVGNLGAYVPKDVLYSTQEVAMDILVRLAACQKKKEYKKNYERLIASMPSAFAEVVTDEDLGPVEAMNSMRPLLLKVNEGNQNITSCTFHELSYDGGNQPRVHKAGALDFCRKWICLTVTNGDDIPGVKIAYSQIVTVHFVDDGSDNDDSKSLELVLGSMPDSLKAVLGLELPTQHSQGVFAIVLDRDAPMQALEDTAKASLHSEEASNTQEMNRQIQLEMDTRPRKTSSATTRSASSGAAHGTSQVTPSGAEGAPTAAAVSRRFEAAMHDQGHAQATQEHAMETDEDNEEEQSRTHMKSVSPMSAAIGSPSRRSARLETKQSQDDAWVRLRGAEAVTAEAKKSKRGQRETDTDDFEEESPRKAAKPSLGKGKGGTGKSKAPAAKPGKPKPKAKAKPSRSESASTMQVPPAKSPARMRRSPGGEDTEPQAGALSFAEADAVMQKGTKEPLKAPAQTYKEPPYVSERDLEHDMDVQAGPEPTRSFAWDESMAMDDDLGSFAQPDSDDREEHNTAALLAEGRARAAAPLHPGLPKSSSRATTSTTMHTERELSYAMRKGGRRVLQDEVSVKKMSTELFSSEEEEEVGSMPEIAGGRHGPGQRQRQGRGGTSSSAAAAATGEHRRGRGRGDAQLWAEDESSSADRDEGEGGVDMDMDEDEDEAYLSGEDDATAGASVNTRSGDRLSFLANEFIKEQAARQRSKVVRMIAAQTDAAIEQVEGYLLAWMSNREDTYKRWENDDKVLVAGFTTAAEAKRRHMQRESSLFAQRYKELSKDLRDRKQEADGMARDIEAYERFCRDEDGDYKEDVKRRYDALTIGLKKVADQEQKANKEAKKRQKQLEAALKEA